MMTKSWLTQFMLRFLFKISLFLCISGVHSEAMMYIHVLYKYGILKLKELAYP